MQHLRPLPLLILLLSAAAAPVAAADGPVRVMVVDYGSDVGFGWPRDRGAWSEVESGFDVDGDGAEDDFRMGWSFSLEQPFSASGFEYDNSAPSARFYGGAIGLVTNHRIPFSEGHMNQDHEFRDDWNLMLLTKNWKQQGYPEGLAFACTGAWIWLKQDFLGGGASATVELDEDSWFGPQISRYWGGLDWGRWVVIDPEGLWISEQSFGHERGDKPGLDGGYEAGGHPVNRSPQVCRPTATRWARWQPSAREMQIDLEACDWQQRRFADVQGFGFVVQRALRDPMPTSSSLTLGEPLALKWHAFAAQALVHRPATSTVAVATTARDGRLVMERGVRFDEWQRVHRRAVTNQRLTGIEPPGSSFLRDGDPGALDLGAETVDGHDRVTDISYLDALVWCNALSEFEGRRPCYYLDAGFEQVLREAIDRNDPAAWEREPSVHLDPSADGFRLPTAQEWQAEGLDQGQWEWVWSDDPERRLALAPGGSQVPVAWPGTGTLRPWQGAPHIGFRVVAGPLGDQRGQHAEWSIGRETALPPATAVDDAALAQRIRERLRLLRLAGGGDLGSGWTGFGSRAQKQGKVEDGSYDLLMAGDLLDYDTWAAVRDRATDLGFRFDRDGDVGSIDLTADERSHRRDEPVTQISWEDALVWCNAASRICGLQPVYHLEPGGDAVLMHSTRFRLTTWQRSGYGNQVIGDREIWVDTAANGFRLPSEGEWRQVVGKPDAKALAAQWRFANSAGQTRAVTAGEMDAAGFRDLAGNASSWALKLGRVDLFGQPLAGASVASIHDQLHFAWTLLKDHPTVSRPFVGLRPVRRAD